MPTNREHFVVVAGQDAANKFDQEILDRCAPGNMLGEPLQEFLPSEDLCRVQEDQGRRGRLEVTMTLSIKGWSFRYNGLQNFAIVSDAPRSMTFAQALEEAQKWVAKDPERRSVICRKDEYDNPRDKF
jgi:hypothetical protein